MGLVADDHERLAVPWRGHQVVFNNRVVDNLSIMGARKEDAPTRGGHDDVVGHGHVRPFLIKGVDALQIGRERELRVRLSDDPVAVDQDVREVVVGNAPEQRPVLSLHRVFVVAVADVEVVVDVVVRD